MAAPAVATWLTFLFLYAPIVVLVGFSFSASRYATVWGGFSLEWYDRLFHDDDLQDALIVTLELAGISTLIATVLGTAAAIGHAKLGVRAGRVPSCGSCMV